VILALLSCLHDFPDREADFDADGIPADDDCDDTDPKVGVASFWYTDADGDGFGVGEPVQTCHPWSNAITSGGDCDDKHVDNFPGNDEVCDERDNDCDDDIDEGAPPSPGRGEVCGDEIDNDCDGSCGDCCFHTDAEGGNTMDAAPFAVFSTKDIGSFGRAIVATDVSAAPASFAVGAPTEETVFGVPGATLPGAKDKSIWIDVDDQTSAAAAVGVVHGSGTNAYFGTALAAIDGGGIFVGAPGAEEVLGKTVTNGAVYRIDDPILAGSDLTVDENDVAFYATGSTATYFGSTILPGPNFGYEKSDQEADVVVSGVNEGFTGTFSSGAVWVFYDAFSESPPPSDVLTGSDAEGGFGAAIAAGDLSGDGADDLLIGKAGPGATGAEVCVFLGGARFGPLTDAEADFSFTSLNAGANLGASLALGDFDDSGSIDVAAGAPMPGAVGTENATVHVYLNDDSWWKSLDDIFLDQDELTFVGTDNDRTGTALLAKDLDLDGFDDLLIGSPAVHGGGHAYLVRMPLTGSIGPVDVVATWSVGSGGADELGFALSAASFGTDEWPDVLLSAPGDRTVYVWDSAGF